MDATPLTEEQQTAPPADEMFVTRSVVSISSSSTNKSSASLAAAKARAKVLAARARTAFVQKENELLLEKARMDAALATLKLDQEIAAAVAEAEALQCTAAELERGSRAFNIAALPPQSPQERTSEYIECHSKAAPEPTLIDSTHRQPQQCNPAASNSAASDLFNGGLNRTRPYISTSQLVKPHPDANSHSSNLMRSRQPSHSTLHEQAPHTLSANHTGFGDIARFLARRELLSSSLTKFDDQPEGYWAWKSSFLNSLEGIGLTCSEELDLLTKWLGPQSSAHVKRIRAVHVNDPALGLRMAWSRLQECYGAAEMIEKALLDRVEKFPRINNKDPQKLRELGDLLQELVSARHEGNLPGLTYLDTARGLNPIVEKLPFGLQEKWISQGSNYKLHYKVHFPPFAYFADFVCREAYIRNDPSFFLSSSAATTMKPDNAVKKMRSSGNFISSHKTEVFSTSDSDTTDSPSARPDVSSQCPIHKKPHPLKRCRGFRTKTIEERKAFLKEAGICFRCCSSSKHLAKDCKIAVQCKECNSDRHIAALHPGPAPWNSWTPESENGGEEKDEPSPTVNSKCTEVCGESNSPRSCSKICLITVHLNGQPERSVRLYAILDDQSNRSLARSEFFDLFGLKGTDALYTLRTCAGLTEMSGRRATSFIAQPLDGSLSINLPTLIECNYIPEDRSEIPTPEVAKHHTHLNSIAKHIPPLDPEAQILLLLGRDVLQVHKVRDQRNGPNNAPYAQRLDLGWVIIGEACLGTAHKTKDASVFSTHILENGRHSHFTPCLNHLTLKEKLTVNNQRSRSPYNLQSSQLACVPAPCSDDDSLGSKIFQRTEDDNKVAPSIEDKQFIKLMDKEMFIDEGNSWVAPLPFRTSRLHLPNNREQALSRFNSLCRTFERKAETKQHFFTFMQRIFDQDHAELAPPLAEGEECWYLPTFGVYHPHKPGQIRVVFDSSAKHLGVSLNDVLLTGPDLNNGLLGVLMRFRREQIAVTADIEQMFHSFIVREDHRNFLRFLWFKNNNPMDEVVEYRMRVHVFGNSPSPAVAIYGLRRAALHGEDEFGHAAKEFIHREFYVDDGLKSLPSVTEAVGLLKAARGMLAMSNLHLHKIASNCPAVMQAFPSSEYAKDLKDLDLDIDSLPVQRSLGLNWDLSNDTFTFRVASTKKPFTRRGVLATVNSLFDPLGLVAPISIQGKFLLRELTHDTVDWDEPLPAEKEAEWIAWRDSLQALEHFETPRCYTSTSVCNGQRMELHVFSDASVKAIAAVAYLKVLDNSGVDHVGFIMGKAKLAPMSVHTVPRLELGAAVLAVEIAELVSRELDVKLDVMRFYTDSKVVLGYIHSVTRRFYVYVSNRVERIRKFSSPEQWHYVPTSQNPADVATRSVPAVLLSNTSWLTGPKFLLLPMKEDAPVDTSYNLVDPESDVEVRSHLTACTNTNLGSQRFERFSTWQSLIRATATLIHIAETIRAKTSKQNTECKGWHQCLKAHMPDNLSKAKQVIIGCAQNKAYQTEMSCLKQGMDIPNNSPLRKLDPVLDDGGLLRIGGRLRHSTLITEEKHPLIVSGRSHIGTLLINYYHERIKHQGRVFTEGAIRSDGIWIVGAKRCIARHLHRCVICNKLRGKTAEQKMADLPSDRLSTEPPFTNVGIDVFGPWSISTRRTRGGAANSKRWGVIFTCLSVRAVHIELIEAMDTSSFINALRRFLATRGPVKLIRSDCGTNFKGACSELKVLLQDDKEPNVSRFLSEEGCTWIFNPPHSSHMGGVWERMIGVSRRILDSMLSQIQPSHLTHEVLSTLMAEVSAIINARPLTTISTDANAPSLLTPTMILTQKVCSPHPPPGCFVDADLHRQQWRRVQHLANTFWERWRREYLSTLQSRSKWQKSHPNIKEGDLVLLRDTQVKRNEWPMALVTKAFPASDGKVRKLELKVARGGTSRTFLRPITEVVMLMSP